MKNFLLITITILMNLTGCSPTFHNVRNQSPVNVGEQKTHKEYHLKKKQKKSRSELETAGLVVLVVSGVIVIGIAASEFSQ